MPVHNKYMVVVGHLGPHICRRGKVVRSQSALNAVIASCCMPHARAEAASSLGVNNLLEGREGAHTYYVFILFYIFRLECCLRALFCSSCVIKIPCEITLRTLAIGCWLRGRRASIHGIKQPASEWTMAPPAPVANDIVKLPAPPPRPSTPCPGTCTYARSAIRYTFVGTNSCMGPSRGHFHWAGRGHQGPILHP